MTDSTRLGPNSQRIAPTRTESELKGRFVQYGRHRRLTFKSNKGKDAVIVRITRLLLGNRDAHEKGWSESHIKQEALEKPDR